jgi:hypothetical protein
VACRHSNQKTEDFSEELVACKFGGSMKLTCNKQLNDTNLWLYEAYDQQNGTWGSAEEMEIVIPDQHSSESPSQ